MHVALLLSFAQMENESTSFEVFSELPMDEVAEVKGEIKLLYEIKDVLDELNIMSVLLQDQRRVFKTLDNIVRSIDTNLFLSNKAEKCGDYRKESFDQIHTLQREKGKVSATHSETDEGETDKGETGEQEMDHDAAPITAHDDLDEEGISAIQYPKSKKIETNLKRTRATPIRERNVVNIWGHRVDTHTTSLPMELVNSSIEDVEGMIDRANQTRKAVWTLLNSSR